MKTGKPNKIRPPHQNPIAISKDGKVLRLVIGKLMAAMYQECRMVDWLTFTRLKVGVAVLAECDETAALRWEFFWRTAYKLGVNKQALKGGLIQTTDALLLAYGAAVMEWVRLVRDDNRYSLWKPDPGYYRIFGQPIQDMHEKIENMAVMKEVENDETGAMIEVVEPGGRVLMTRGQKDIDIKDWGRHMDVGGESAAGIHLRFQQGHSVFYQAQRSAGTTGIIIGTRTGDAAYQRLPNGSLVNVLKNPDLVRKDLIKPPAEEKDVPDPEPVREPIEETAKDQPGQDHPQA